MKTIHPTVQALLTEIESYLQLTGDTMTQFGLEVANDSHFIPRLKQGRQPRLATIDRVRRYIDSQTSTVTSSRKYRPPK